MQKKDIKEVLNRIRSGNYTPEDERMAKYWLHYLNNQEAAGLSDEELIEIGEEMWLATLSEIHEKDDLKLRRLWLRVVAAASIIVCLGMSGYYLLSRHQQVQLFAQNQFNGITAGGNKAILTLANGNQINLTRAKNGQLTTEGNTVIDKKADGQVSYQTKSGNAGTSAALTFNTISTPRGGQYQVILPDGSHVWLNAASSITFPTAFSSINRQVVITGEAYFEVVHNKDRPFLVKSGSQTVEVLGTHFNINAYTDEPNICTTLLEGSVKVTSAGSTVMIKPGQEALLTGHQFSVGKADVEKAVAWTDNNFVFNGDNIQPIMREISRWYDVDIDYEGSMAHKDFVGSISRFDNVAQIFNTLQLTKIVHFKVEGRRITVVAN
jgi:transmembrane sensor